MQTSIGMLVGMLVIGLSALLLFLEYREGRTLALAYAEARFAQASLAARDNLRTVLGPTGQVLHSLIDAVDADPGHFADSDGQAQSLLASIRRSPISRGC